jgi:hypothetical protein
MSPRGLRQDQRNEDHKQDDAQAQDFKNASQVAVFLSEGLAQPSRLCLQPAVGPSYTFV